MFKKLSEIVNALLVTLTFQTLIPSQNFLTYITWFLSRSDNYLLIYTYHACTFD